MIQQPLLDTPTWTRVPRDGERGDETNGQALIRGPMGRLAVIFSDGDGWDHVSVSRTDRIPIWQEMCWVKDRFFDPEDCVVQFHPPASRYVNTHPFVLHLWKWQGGEFPQPWVGLV